MVPDVERNNGGLPLRELGRTGLKVSNMGLGGGHFIGQDLDEAESIRLLPKGWYELSQSFSWHIMIL